VLRLDVVEPGSRVESMPAAVGIQDRKVDEQLAARLRAEQIEEFRFGKRAADLEGR
jgi:hypothetical protein